MHQGREGIHPHAPIGWPIMSDAALKLVAACTHPQVKGATRRFYKAVADQVPAGQTTTPPLTLPELALAAEQTARTAQTARNLLTGLGLVAVHDGGRGHKARYEVLHLDGCSPPKAVPLPLRADLREAPRTIKERSTSEISYDQTANNVGSYVRADLHQHRKFFLCWAAELREHRKSFLRWLGRTIKQRSTSEVPYDQTAINIGNQAKEERKTSDPTFAFEAPSSSYVRSSYEDLVVVGGTDRAPAAEAPDPDPASAFMAWFEATYPTGHHGAVCRVDRTKDGPLVRELLQRPRTDLAHLQAMTLLLWAITSDGVVRSHSWWIAERVTVRNIFILHRKADFLDQELRRRQAAEAVREDVWAQVLVGITARVDSHTFHTWWKDSRLVADRGDVIVVQLNPDPAKHTLFKDWIQKHYAGALAESLAAVRPGARVEFFTTRERNVG